MNEPVVVLFGHLPVLAIAIEIINSELNDAQKVWRQLSERLPASSDEHRILPTNQEHFAKLQRSVPRRRDMKSRLRAVLLPMGH